MDLLIFTFSGLSPMWTTVVSLGLLSFVVYFVNSCITLTSIRRGLSKVRRGASLASRSGGTCSGVACSERGCFMPGGYLQGCGVSLGHAARAAAGVAAAASAGAAAVNVVGVSGMSAVSILLILSAGAVIFVAALFLGAVAAQGRSRGSLHAGAVGCAPLATALSVAAATALIMRDDGKSGETMSIVAAALAALTAVCAAVAAAGAAYLLVLWWHPSYRTQSRGADSPLAWNWPRPRGAPSAGCALCLCMPDEATEDEDEENAFGLDHGIQGIQEPLMVPSFGKPLTPAAYDRAPTPMSQKMFIVPPPGPSPSAPSLSPTSPVPEVDNAAIRAAAARAVAALGNDGRHAAPTPLAPPADAPSAIRAAAARAVAQLSAAPAATSRAIASSTPVASADQQPRLFRATPASLLPLSPPADVSSPPAGWSAGATSPVYSPPPASAPLMAAPKGAKGVATVQSPLEDGELPSP